MIPDDRVYTKNHEWVKPGTALVEIGVTEPILRKVIPLIAIELPDPDDVLQMEMPFGELEGLAHTHQLYPPVEGSIIEVNHELVWNHKKLLKDPYGEGWLLKVRVDEPEELLHLRHLLNARIYRRFCAKDLGEKLVGE